MVVVVVVVVVVAVVVVVVFVFVLLFSLINDAKANVKAIKRGQTNHEKIR